jgi:predicted Zn-dependent peptidase
LPGAELQGGIRTSVLDGRMRVVTERMADVRSVSLGFWVGTGSRHEDERIAGVSHFLEHLLFKGTDRRSAQEIAEAIDAVGGEMNAFTTKEYTAFYVRVLDDHLDLALDVLSDIFWSPAFRPDEVEAERQVILEEIAQHEDTPDDLVHEVFAEALFPGHPLGREVLGTTTTIGALSRDDIRGYFTDRYHPANVVVAAAGHLDHDVLVDGVQQRLAGHTGDWAAQVTPPATVPVPVTVVNRPTEQAHLVVGMRSLDRHDDDRFALSLVNHLLGGGMSSRLFQEIREKRGLAYSVYSYRSSYADTGALAIYAGTTPRRAQEVLRIVGDELDRMVADGITEEELEAAKGNVKGSLALSLEDSGGRMNRIGRAALVHGEVLTFDQLIARTEAVTLDDVARVLARGLTGPRALAVVGPFDGAGAFEGVMAA